MKVKNNFPASLQECIRYFADPQVAFDFMVNLRWPNGVCCPRCQSKKIGFIATRKVWECKECKTKRQFTVKVGTIMEDSPISLDKWLCAIWLIANAKNGISSYELGRSIDITQKSAWFVLHRIRLALQNGSLMKFKGEVEVDETFIGGLARNMHAKKRKAKNMQKDHKGGKVPVQGFLQRGGKGKSKVIARVVQDTGHEGLLPNVYEIVEPDSAVYTDAHHAYKKMGSWFAHEVVDHAECYVKGKVTTNGIENFWSLLKRSLKGTYVSVEAFHLFRYLDEQTFRFNEREENDATRFLKAVAGMIGKGITYAKLTGESETPEGATA